MPIVNIRLIFFAIVISLACASRTSIREQVLLNSFRKIQRLSLRSPSEQDLFEGAMEGMTEKLRTKYNDPYTYYENPEKQKEIRNQLENTLVGIGVFIELNPKDQSLLLYPLQNSPALQAGVRYGDKLVQVNGEDIAGLSIKDVATKMKGGEGTSVALTVRHRDTETSAEIKIIRTLQRMETIIGDSLKHDGSWNYTLETDPEVAYLCIRDSFSEETAVEMRAALEQLNKNDQIRGLILDVRGNPGGYLQAAVGVCNLFLDKGTIVTVQRRDGSTKDVYTADGTSIWKKNLAILVNEESASASEIVAACLQDNKRAIVVGMQSYGKGTVQEMFQLPMNLGSLRLTDAEYRRPSGQNINRYQEGKEAAIWGVMPNEGYSVPLSREQEIFLFRIRRLRSVILENELKKNVEEFVKRVTESGSIFVEDILAEESKDEEQEVKTELVKTSPFQPEGEPPYYDTQLRKAVEAILNQNHNPTKF